MLGGLVIAAAQHQHLAQPFGYAVADGDLGVAAAALGDAVLLLGNFQGMLGARLFGGGQGVRQSACTLAGGIEMVGKIEDVVRRLLFQVRGCAAMQFLAIARPQSLEKRLPKLVVQEDATCVILLRPDEVPLPRLVERADGLAWRQSRQRGGKVQGELLAQNGAGRQQAIYLCRQSIHAPGQEGGGVPR